MLIKQDPITGLYCRNDGAVLMPPDGYRFKSFRWTFGCKNPIGYRAIKFQGKPYKVHQMVCRAFHGLAPADKPEVDHINRIRDDNRPENLRWASRKENNNNTSRIARSIEKYGTRCCDNRLAYDRARRETHREEYNARQRVRYAAKYAEKKAQGLTWKRLNGRWGWFPCVRMQNTL